MGVHGAPIAGQEDPIRLFLFNQIHAAVGALARLVAGIVPHRADPYRFFCIGLGRLFRAFLFLALTTGVAAAGGGAVMAVVPLLEASSARAKETPISRIAMRTAVDPNNFLIFDSFFNLRPTLEVQR